MLISQPAALVPGGPARALAIVLRRAARDGVFDSMPPDQRSEVLAALDELEAAGDLWLRTSAANARTQARSAAPARPSAGQTITIREAAAMLDVTQARVRQIAPALGQKRGGRWLLDRAAVLAELERRAA